ncbi:gliding motility lipoprotein GldH [Ekhidna sp. To15]|uniref:gliding motility lipoprotein GldH n=1 Tax=Ekhidna sp. To15 TaxID=3395267 RepID=UPI003F5284D5
MKNCLILAAFVMLTSCDSSRVYEDYNDLEEAFWHLDSIQTFDFKIQDTTKSYNLLGTFRNASSYPFYNLYFQYTLHDSTGGILLQELKQVDLFDPKTGEPNGSGLGDLFDHSFALVENHKFESEGQYSLSFEQYMRRDTLPFILSVGARVEFAQ